MNEASSSPDDIRKDTSLAGREEEVITNTEVQKQATNNDSSFPSPVPDADLAIELNENMTDSREEPLAKKAFKEGLSDNSNTDEK